MSIVSRTLISLVSLWAAFGSYVFDWNATHIYNPKWPAHAKFHNAQTMLLGTLLGVLALTILWTEPSAKRAVYSAAVLASLYWLTQAAALLFPGTALVDPDLAKPGQWPAQLIVDAVMLELLTVSVVMQRRLSKLRALTSD